MDQAEGLELHDLAGREELSRKALELFGDPRAMHLLAQSLVSQGRSAEALPWLKEARRWAEYPNRVVPEVSSAILSFEGEPGVLGVLDGETLFRGEDGTDPIDYRFVYDHCHPSVEGNWVLAGAIAERLLKESSLGLSQDPLADVRLWTQDGQAQVLEQTERNPRLWEWTGLTFHPDRVEYIADAQGQWRERSDQAERDVLSPQASASDWLWVGNYRFYDYRIGPALAAWTRALELDPGLCLAHANAAYALRSIGRRDSALRSASAAVECDPEATDLRAERDLLLRLKN
jgi:tetratricopeptide (TPR) repeat protein